jgi:hypothetical protein
VTHQPLEPEPPAASTPNTSAPDSTAPANSPPPSPQHIPSFDNLIQPTFPLTPILHLLSYDFQPPRHEQPALQEAGLTSLQLEFHAVPKRRDTEQQHTQTVRDLLKYYKQYLDIVIATFSTNTLDSYINDGPYHFLLGYSFRGTFNANPEPPLDKLELAQKLFNFDKTLHDHQPEKHCVHTVQLETSHPLPNSIPLYPTLTISLELGHILNYSFLHLTQTLQPLQLSFEAKQSMQDLQRLLNHKTQPSVDDLFDLVPRKRDPARGKPPKPRLLHEFLSS